MMVGLLNRVSRYFDYTADRVLKKAPKRPSHFAADKIEAVGSYAEFCRTGTSPAYPLEIFLEISNICDLKCAMCVQFSALNAHRLNQIKRTSRGFMDQGEISENIEEALKHAQLVHCFGYGEPTIHPTFKSFLDLISRYEVMIDFFTNGMHLDEEFCQFLVDRRVYQITVSFSGATKDVYESVYLGGNFEKVLGGLKRLADIKKAQGSRFPIIEINSLGFRDHVAQFDQFVSLMADHGVNTVMLKPLHAYKTIPELFEHVSIMRPAHEGKIVNRAIKIGRQRGVEVNAELYVQEAAADDQEYDRQVDALKGEAEKAFGDGDRKFGQNPVSRFAELSQDLEPLRGSDTERRAPLVLGLESPSQVAQALLEVQPLEKADGSASAFHCMEPFKTLYLSRNGAAKPCCFANPQSWYFGDAKQDNALSIWRGSGFEVTRSAIAETKYPMKSCEVCIRRKSGPQGHLVQHLLRRYLAWHAEHFDVNLGQMIEAQAPGALRLTARSPAAIMEARNANAVTPPADLPEAYWPFEQSPARTDQFLATGNALAHREFLPIERSSAKLQPRAKGDPSPDLLVLLEACARRYAGKGCIVDLGLPSAAVSGLVAGLSANPAIASIVASFGRNKHSIIERFGGVAGPNDAPDPETFIKPQIGQASKLRWLASKPIELCVINGRSRDRLIQGAFRQLLPHFIVGETIIVQTDFYHHGKFYPKVLMGYLGGSFEWLGQVGLNAIFRFTRPVPAELAALDPYPGLSESLCLRFHRQWDHADLPREIQIRLDLSYVQLLAASVGRDAALSHLDMLEERYADEPASKAVKKANFEKVFADVRLRLGEPSTAAGP